MAGVLSVACLGSFAQETGKKEKKESQEIIIRKSGDKNEKITVVVDGNDITINGKPLSEFKDDNIKVTKRKTYLREGSALTYFNDANSYGMFDSDNKPHAFLGISTGDLEEGEKGPGARITEVTKESAAEKAGLKKGDIITRIDEKKVEDFNDVTEAISAHKPKDEITVYYNRDGKENSTRAILGEHKGGGLAYSISGPGALREFTIPRIYGNPLADMDMTERYKDAQNAFGRSFEMFRGPRLGLKIQDTEEGNGVKILSVEEGSTAEKAGLKKDDIVTEIGGTKVLNTDEAREQLQENAEKATYTIKALRNGTEKSFEVKIHKKLKTTNL
jgi:serine protease Do